MIPEAVLAHVPAFLMVLFRISGIFIFAPLLGSSTVPMRMKVIFALGLAGCVYPMLLMPGRPAAELMGASIGHEVHLWALGAAVAVELLIGLAIGFGATLPIIAAQVGGHVIDQQMGLGLAGVYNPELNEQSGVVGEFYFLAAVAIFVIMGGHRVLLVTVAGSFDHVPLGGFDNFGGLLALMLGLMQSMFELALKVAAPLLAVIFLETVAMGFMARTVPQMNIMSVGFALRIMLGALVLIAAVVPQFDEVAQAIQFTMRRLMLVFAM